MAKTIPFYRFSLRSKVILHSQADLDFTTSDLLQHTNRPYKKGIKIMLKMTIKNYFFIKLLLEELINKESSLLVTRQTKSILILFSFWRIFAFTESLLVRNLLDRNISIESTLVRKNTVGQFYYLFLTKSFKAEMF